MKVYRAKLTPEERAELQELLGRIAGVAVEGHSGSANADTCALLLKADEGVAGPRLTDDKIAEALEINRTTVERARVRCVEEGFEAALRTRPSHQLHPRKLDGIQEAHFPAPNGRARWSLRQLADRLVELEIVDNISHETVRQTLKKRTRPWLKEQYCLQEAPSGCSSTTWTTCWTSTHGRAILGAQSYVYTMRPQTPASGSSELREVIV